MLCFKIEFGIDILDIKVLVWCSKALFLFTIFLFGIFASAIATIGAAAVMHRFIEQPVIDFSHWFTKQIQQRLIKYN